MSSFFNRKEFSRFLNALRIDSKEKGLLPLGPNLIGSQNRLLDELSKGFEQNVHQFIVLKCRQVGISSIFQAIDLYWINKYKGLNGAVITQDDATRDQFRTTLQLYRDGLDEEWQRDVMDDNRNQLVLKNGSKLAFRVAGTTVKKGGSKLGRSGALALCHSSETAFYGDFSGIDSLRASFAQSNPVRLFCFESTANGTGGYEDMWNEARDATTMRQIFISWWCNNFYRCERGTALFNRYWGYKGRMTREEYAVSKEVEKTYGIAIDGPQWAWYRYYANEVITDEVMMRQEFPHLPDQAFIDTGSTFFRGLDITAALKQTRQVKKTTQTYRVETGHDFWNTKVTAGVGPRATLTIYQEPVPGAHYAVGCDPAFSSSDEADNNVVSVWRCWYNRLEQVAEFADNSISTHAVAWVFCYLAGYYGRSTTNLEVNGPGQQVLSEIQNLKRQASSKIQEAEGIREVLKYMKQYLYRKIDTFNAPNALHTKTNHEIKERLMNSLRDYFERGILVVRSAALVDEMKTIVRDGGAAPCARKGKNDDRVVSAGLACMCWNDQMRQTLLAERVIWSEDDKTGEAIEQPRNVMEKLLQEQMLRIGILKGMDVPAPKVRAYRGRQTWREKVEAQRRRGL
jgi:hypothetical protein